MPSASSRETLVRHWYILQMLPKRETTGLSYSQIRDRLESIGITTTKRTVERDFDVLPVLFPLCCNNKSKPHGWYWHKDSHFDIAGMELPEAMTYGLLEDLLKTMVPAPFSEVLAGRFARAREVLEQIPKSPASRWKDLVRYVPPGPAFIPATVAPEVWETVQECLLRRKQLEVTYRAAASDEGKSLVLHPLSLIQQGARSYLLATTFHYQDLKLYAIHRMSGPRVLDAAASRPKGFSLDKYLAAGGAQFGSGGNIKLKARLSDELAALLLETPLAGDQKISTRGGVHTLTVTVPDSWQLRFWIQSQGARIVVTQPARLRQEIIESLKDALGAYEGPSADPSD